MTTNGSPGTADEKSPWTRPGFIAATVVVVLLIVLGVILAVTGGNDGSPPTDAAKPAPPPAASQANGDASVCGLDPGSQTIPDSSPKAAWKLRGTMAVPTSRSFGPRHFRDGVPSCFAHSPTGALFATPSIIAALSVASHRSDAEQITTLKAMAAPGPALDAATARRGGGGQPSADSSAGVQVAGFKVVRYEPSSAVIDLAFRVDRAGASGYVHATSTLRWDSGDWKIVLSQDGRPWDSMQQIPDLTGYIAWSGV
jgi:hypothetical protein